MGTAEVADYAGAQDTERTAVWHKDRADMPTEARIDIHIAYINLVDLFELHV